MLQASKSAVAVVIILINAALLLFYIVCMVNLLVPTLRQRLGRSGSSSSRGVSSGVRGVAAKCTAALAALAQGAARRCRSAFGGKHDVAPLAVVQKDATKGPGDVVSGPFAGLSSGSRRAGR